MHPVTWESPPGFKCQTQSTSNLEHQDTLAGHIDNAHSGCVNGLYIEAGSKSIADANKELVARPRSLRAHAIVENSSSQAIWSDVKPQLAVVDRNLTSR